MYIFSSSSSIAHAQLTFPIELKQLIGAAEGACLPDWLYTLHAYSMLYLHAYILRERAINLTFFLANAEEEEAYVYYYAIFVVTFSASPRATIPRDADRWWSYSTTQPDARKKVKS